MAAASGSSKVSETTDHVIRIPSIPDGKKFSILKFNGNLNVDVTQWNKVSLERENNAPAYAGYSTAETPEFGAGSEYGKKARDEARRKKMGRYAKTYKADNQPWQMNVQANQGALERKFKGIKEGTVSEFSDYWIFVKAADGVFDAYPIADWYNFLPQARYKTLDIDEAEEQFLQRNKVLNQFAVMKKPGGASGSGGADSEDKSSAVKDLRISDDKARDDEDETFNSDSDGDEKDSKEEKPKKKGGKAPKKAKPKPTKKGSDDEIASADSDDGDEEGEEVDYMSDSESSSSDDNEAAEVEKEDKQLVGVAEESGLKAMIDSDAEEEQEEEENKEKDVNTTDMLDEENSRASLGDGPPRTAKEKSKDDDSSSSDSDSDDPDKDNMQSALFMLKAKPLDTAAGNTDSNDAGGPSGLKRKEMAAGETTTSTATPETSPAKKVKTTAASPPPKGITEEEVKRYLQRKPHATKDLVAKFKSKSLGLEKEEIVNRLAEILKKLKPEQSKVNGVLYFSIKS